MNHGSIPNNIPSNTNSVFFQNINFAGPSSNFLNTAFVNPQYGYNSHYVSVYPVSSALSTPYANIIFLDGKGFKPGYIVTFSIYLPGTLVFSPAALDLSIINSSSGNTLYVAPTGGLPEQMIVQFIFDGYNWIRISNNNEMGIGNSMVSRALSMGHGLQLLLNSTSTLNSGVTSVQDSGMYCYATANTTVANSAASVRNFVSAGGMVTSATRTLWQKFFASTWAVSATITPQLWSATSTSKLKFGLYQQWQNVNTASSGATVGEATCPAVGFEIQGDGSWYAFRYEGSTPSWQITSLGYTQGDLGGGQGGQMHKVAIYYSPSGTVEWYINKILRLRLTGLVFNWSSFTQYPCCQISATTGATTNAANNGLVITAERVQFYQP